MHCRFLLSYLLGLFILFCLSPIGAKEAVEIRKAIPFYTKVRIDVLKVEVNSAGKVIDSILNVTDSHGIPLEMALVTLDERLSHAWVVSTAQNYIQRKHKQLGWITPVTPEGEGFHPQYLSIAHSSTAYGDGTSINMPFAVFFNGGIALHGTTPGHFQRLGYKDSGGCVRFYPTNARILWRYINPLNEEIEDIQNRVTINVYGFDQSSKATHNRLRDYYAESLDWIEEKLRQNLAEISGVKRSR